VLVRRLARGIRIVLPVLVAGAAWSLLAAPRDAGGSAAGAATGSSLLAFADRVDVVVTGPVLPGVAVCFFFILVRAVPTALAHGLAPAPLRARAPPRPRGSATGPLDEVGETSVVDKGGKTR
jgi:hypothetical protein